MLKESLTDLVRTHTGWQMGRQEVEVRSQGKSLCLAQLQSEQTPKTPCNCIHCSSPLEKQDQSAVSDQGEVIPEGC